jgi:hypothetical protein
VDIRGYYSRIWTSLEKTRRKARRSTARRRARYILQEERARTSRLHVHCTLYPLQEGRSDRRSARRPVAQHSLAILAPPPSLHAATAETRNLVLVVALATKPCTAPRTGPIEALCIVHRARPREKGNARVRPPRRVQHTAGIVVVVVLRRPEGMDHAWMRGGHARRFRVSSAHVTLACGATLFGAYVHEAGAREKLGGWSLARTRNPDDRAAESLNKLDRSLYDGRG